MARHTRTILIGAALAAVALGYVASPYLAVARLAQDLEARRVEAVTARLDLPQLRQSIARQLARAFLARNPDIAKQSPLGRQAGAMVVGGFVNAYLAETFTPEAVEALLRDSRPPAALAGEAASLPSLGRLRGGLELLRTAGFTGPTAFRAEAPDSAEGTLALGLRLQGVRWRVTSIELPRSWIDRLVDDLGRKLPSTGS
ncbi:DUF2939 domain-containing protein [Bosea sp. TWI1241]|uniref:DUF2939 domain-containing protein n=1 Tax=Bosea sp. TWI1241 TaxID=3148904 RepID=UPI00320A0D94